MGTEVLSATGRWEDFASFMVPRKPGGCGCVCIAYRNSSPAGSSAASFPELARSLLRRPAAPPRPRQQLPSAKTAIPLLDRADRLIQRPDHAEPRRPGPARPQPAH